MNAQPLPQRRHLPARPPATTTGRHSAPRSRHVFVVLVTAAACAGDAPGPDAAAPTPEPTVVASGLNGPMGLLVEEDGTVWVIDSGVGGDQVIPTLDPVSHQPADGAFGMTSRIVRIDPDGAQTEIATLPSLRVGGLAYGGARLALRDGVLYATSGGWVEGAADPVHSGVVRIEDDGSVSEVANTREIEAVRNPDGARRETNPFGLAAGPDGTLWMTDAAGNTLYRIDPDAGTIDLVAVFDPIPGPVPNPGHGGARVVEAVPTAVTFLDGEAYVAFLPGLPMMPGSARVVRVSTDGDVTEYATNLSRLTDLEAGPDGHLYAVSMGDPAEGVPTGAVVRITEGAGSRPILTGLSLPTAIGFDGAGNVYVTVNGVGEPGSGAVLRYPRLIQVDTIRSRVGALELPDVVRRASRSRRHALVALHLPLPGLSGGTDVRAQTQWQVDSASVRFEIRNAGLPVRGSFSGLHAEAGFDPTMPARGALVASIDAATIETGIGLRDRHLRRPGYFDVERYPRMRLESVRFTSSDKPGRYTGIFILEIKGTRREVSFPFAFTTDGRTGRFAATFTIDRRDFGIGESSMILADDVTIHVDVTVRSVSRAARPHSSPRSIRSTA